MADIFGVGYNNEGVKKYREFSDPKLKKESEKFISDLMKDSTINESDLEIKAYKFLNKYKDSKLFTEIKQKLFLRLQKEIKNQRAGLNASGSTADATAADKISKLYVVANIVKHLVLQDTGLVLTEWKEQFFPKKAEGKPASQETAPQGSAQQQAASQKPAAQGSAPEKPPAPPPSAANAPGATTAAAPAASAADKELEEVKEKLLTNLKSAGIDTSNLNIAVRKLDNGLFEIDINAPKDGKFVNPEGVIDKDGKILIDYFGIVRDPNYTEMLNKNNLIQHQDEKSKIVHFHDKATYNNNEENKISTFDAFYRINTNNFLENKFAPPLKSEEKDEIVTLLKNNNCMLGSSSVVNSKLYFLIYSSSLKKSRAFEINSDQDGKISFANFKSKLEEIFASIKAASQSAPGASAGPVQPEKPTTPPPAMPGEQGAAPAVDATAAKIGNITPSFEGDQAALKELGLSFKLDGSDPNNYTIESTCNLIDYMRAVTGGDGDLDLETLKHLDYKSSEKLDKPINLANATKIKIIGEPTTVTGIYSAAICVYNKDKTIDVIRIKGEPKTAEAPAKQAAGTAQNKPEIMANKEIVYNNNKDLLAKAGITFTETVGDPDTVHVTLKGSIIDNFNVSVALINNKSEEKDAEFESLNAKILGGTKMAADYRTKKIEVVEENGVIKLYSYDTADDGKQTIGILKFEPKKSAAPAKQAAGSTATTEDWSAANRKTTPSAASTEAAATATVEASADTAELDAVKAKFMTNNKQLLKDVPANDIVLKKLDNGLFEIDISAKNDEFLNPEFVADADGKRIINYTDYFDKDVSKYMDSKLLEENNLVERKEDGKFHFYDKTTNTEISSFDVFSKINANHELSSKHFNARLKPEEKQDIANLLQQKGYILTGIGDMYKSFGGAIAAGVGALDYLDISIYDSKEKKMKTFEIKCTNGKISFEDLKNCINNPVEYGTHKKAEQSPAAPAGTNVKADEEETTVTNVNTGEQAVATSEGVTVQRISKLQTLNTIWWNRAGYPDLSSFNMEIGKENDEKHIILNQKDNKIKYNITQNKYTVIQESTEKPASKEEIALIKAKSKEAYEANKSSQIMRLIYEIMVSE